MDPHLLSFTAQLSNDELLARVKHLVMRERNVTVALIAHLAELDARRLHLAEGYSSLFVYCTQVLHLSEHAAYGRIAAARAARKFPVLLERLSEGSLNLTSVVLLAAHLSPQNHQDLPTPPETRPGDRSRNWSRDCAPSQTSRPPSAGSRMHVMPMHRWHRMPRQTPRRPMTRRRLHPWNN